MHPRIPPPIQPLLETYITRVDQTLPGFMTAFYVHGSIALDAFNERFSDIDFITVVSRRATNDDVERLRAMHQQLVGEYPGWKLEGSYLQSDDLGQPEGAVQPYPCYHDGRLNPKGYHDINLVTWWVLKTKGIALVGSKPQTLDYTVDWDVLVTDMRLNHNSYWMRHTRDPSRIAWLLTDYGIQWTALGVLRQFYTFREHDLISKSGAGEYALKHTPERWHRLIQEAINIREQTKRSLYKSRLSRAMDAHAFLKYIIQTCNAIPLPETTANRVS